ncbi:unnamed protein product [Moneuplotes crassus]|uniref:Uncharacterized protein n=1 Tax=Euplotes crassus TaxID=5936 RepID=A0AAD2CXS2_EUPCR|nr:unnamed protein product [Moneuplotes crassus]
MLKRNSFDSQENLSEEFLAENASAKQVKVSTRLDGNMKNSSFHKSKYCKPSQNELTRLIDRPAKAKCWSLSIPEDEYSEFLKREKSLLKNTSGSMIKNELNSLDRGSPIKQEISFLLRRCVEARQKKMLLSKEKLSPKNIPKESLQEEFKDVNHLRLFTFGEGS